MKFTFKSYSGNKNSSNSQQKRRDQVRRAQKTHRERKEAYIKSLEQEIVHLRANEGRIMQETRGLYAQIETLKRLLTENGTQVPAEKLQAYQKSASGQDILDGSFELSIETMEKQVQHRQQRIRAQRGGSNTFQYDFPSPVTTEQAPPPTTIDTRRLGQLDLTAVGLDFILSLESPCLAHNIPSSQDSPTGHALTVSATLLHHHPAPPQQRLSLSGNANWEVSALDIERLLDLSSSVPLDHGEVTPVQAWDSIRKHREFGQLEVTRLEGLKEKLMASVKCYG
ncbi:hypothetical protein EJ07DRAFT_141799 [Lizonia empirigonia]|nr:hypothetical protein EJ07DRAFT_141799 [Lizonia empirigonia]